MDEKQSIATLVEQGKWVKLTLQEMKENNLKVWNTLDDLKSFKWKAIGYGAAMGSIGAMLFQLFIGMMHK